MGAQRPKQYLELLGTPLLARTLAVFDRMPECRRIVIATDDRDALQKALAQAQSMLEKEGLAGGDPVPDKLKARIARRLSSLGYESQDIWRILERLRSEA